VSKSGFVDQMEVTLERPEVFRGVNSGKVVLAKHSKEVDLPK